MHKPILTIALALALAAAAAVAAQAQTDEDYSSVGPYVGAGGVYSVQMFDGNVNADNSSGFNVRTGFRLHPNFAMEALYEYYAKWDTKPGDISGWSVSANLKGYLMTGRWQPYAVLGLGYLSMESDPGSHEEGDFMMRFGGGFEFNLTKNWQIGPEVAYVLPFGDLDNFDFLTVSGGVRYSFR